MTLSEIRARAETAGAGEQRELLIEAWNALQTPPTCPDWDIYNGTYIEVSEGQEKRWGAFRQKLDAEAYIDAVLMLLPQRWNWSFRSPCKDSVEPSKAFARLETDDFESITWGKGKNWITDITSGREAFSHAATTALALLAAICAAMEGSSDD